MVSIIVGDLHCQISADGGLLNFLSKYMRSENDYWVRKSNPRIPKYNYFITKDGTFLTGFLPRVVTLLKRNEIKYTLKDNRKIKSIPDIDEVKILLNSMEVNGNQLKLRDYQLESLIVGLINTRGVFGLATGAGKTVVMAALMLAWRKKTVVVINAKDLAHQLRREIEDYTQHEVGFIGDGIWNPKDFTVAIDKSLLSRERGGEFLSTIEYLIYDEVHHIQANTWRKIARLASGASIRHGFSGTPETSEIRLEGGGEGNNDMYIEGYIGPTIKRVTTRDLINLGYLSDCEVTIINNTVYFDSNPLPYMDEYRRIIMEDDDRNHLIATMFKDGYDKGEQVIGFVDRIEHGNEIYRILTEEMLIPDEQVLFVHGSSYNREEDLERFRNGESQILFGTVLSEGLNFICDRGILIGGGKSKNGLRQKIGRILRKPKSDTGDVDKHDDRVVRFIDCRDDGHPYFSGHSSRRISTYREDGYSLKFVEVEEAMNAKREESSEGL